MNRAKPLALFAIVLGFLMFCLWSYFLLSSHIPGYADHPIEIKYHLIVEFSTAIMLIISGSRVIFSNGNGEGMLLMSMGMLFYTLLNSSGYYAERAGTGIITLFFIMLGSAIYFTVMAFHGSRQEARNRKQEEGSM